MSPLKDSDVKRTETLSFAKKEELRDDEKKETVASEERSSQTGRSPKSAEENHLSRIDLKASLRDFTNE